MRIIFLSNNEFINSQYYCETQSKCTKKQTIIFTTRISHGVKIFYISCDCRQVQKINQYLKDNQIKEQVSLFQFLKEEVFNQQNSEQKANKDSYMNNNTYLNARKKKEIIVKSAHDFNEMQFQLSSPNKLINSTQMCKRTLWGKEEYTKLVFLSLLGLKRKNISFFKQKSRDYLLQIIKALQSPLFNLKSIQGRILASKKLNKDMPNNFLLVPISYEQNRFKEWEKYFSQLQRLRVLQQSDFIKILNQPNLNMETSLYVPKFVLNSLSQHKTLSYFGIEYCNAQEMLQCIACELQAHTRRKKRIKKASAILDKYIKAENNKKNIFACKKKKCCVGKSDLKLLKNSGQINIGKQDSGTTIQSPSTLLSVSSQQTQRTDLDYNLYYEIDNFQNPSEFFNFIQEEKEEANDHYDISLYLKNSSAK